MSKINLKYRGFDLEISYSIQPSESSNNIREHMEEISEILLNGVDVYGLLEPQADEIEEAIWKELKRL